MTHQFDDQLGKLMDVLGRELAGLAAAVVEEGAIAYEGYFGRRYIDGDERAADLPVTADTMFRIASISKLVATLGLMQLVEAGAADLDGDVSDYLPFRLRNPHFPHEKITLRQLLSHTSSIRDATAYTIPIPHTLEAFFVAGSPYFEEGAHWDNNHRPGAFFCYCNLNYGVMATVIERLSGQRFDQFMMARLFRPLGITASYNVALLPGELIRDVATLYRRVDGRWVAQADDYRGVKPRPLAQLENPDAQAEYEAKFGRPTLPQDLRAYELGTNGTLFSPQGGLRISVRGLVRLMQCLFRGGEGILRPESIQQMVREQWGYDPAEPNGDYYGGLMRSWGLSVQRFTHTRELRDDGRVLGDRLIASPRLVMRGHLGEAYGLLSGFFFDLEKKRGIVYAFSGTSPNLEAYPGSYSSFTRWEEQILTVLTADFTDFTM